MLLHLQYCQKAVQFQEFNSQTDTRVSAWLHTLRDNGVPTKFIAYPTSGHWPDDPVRTRDIYRHWIEWLDQYIGPADLLSR